MLPLMDSRLPVVFSAKMDMGRGYTRDQIRHHVRSGRWRQLRRGCYCEADHYSALAKDDRSRHVLLVAAELPSEHRGSEDALRATSVGRTVVDIARRAAFIDAVMVADAALRKGLVTKDQLRSVLAAQAGWLGTVQASQIIAFADARSESPLESRSRVRIHQHGLPAPEPQFKVYDESGKLIARADFGWKKHRTLGEADGKVKYADGKSETLFNEKLREDAVRRLHWEVVRWTSSEVERDFRAVERRILDGFASADERGWTERA